MNKLNAQCDEQSNLIPPINVLTSTDTPKPLMSDHFVFCFFVVEKSIFNINEMKSGKLKIMTFIIKLVMKWLSLNQRWIQSILVGTVRLQLAQIRIFDVPHDTLETRTPSPSLMFLCYIHSKSISSLFCPDIIPATTRDTRLFKLIVSFKIIII